ncbi:MAG: hypothetical protein JRG97_03440 [Deltaproteobacteria bacterium]|nr:hypothetical protein [Deltaproteobacteria bacterium]MBW2051547.1 hypothetical protein [Deltaproteobacteria bacterium]MBW2140112.1 hypothetical protein [Deltaproteobacteria bacterium]MBW2322037.1 hypothetical protein [Deltaproteobacteria bacterium]
MPKPQYPTQKGLWSKGKRKEEGYQNVQLGMPYSEAVKHFRQASEGRDDFDPAVLLVWGTMQATAVLNILKAAEETFGEAGQEVVRKAINKAGYEAMAGFIEHSSFPENLDEIERASYIVTGINTVLYASLEDPSIASRDRCEFDILWCPHQDRYTAFDCRVQRYFVEGMFQAMKDLGQGNLTARVEKLIPHRAECCHFVIESLKDHEGKNPWRAYSDELGKRAFKKLKEK